MKIVLAGGHLSPALSVLQALPEETKVLFVGRKYALEGDQALSLEYATMKELNVPFVSLNTGRLQRKFSKYTILSLFKLPFGLIKSIFVLLKFRPDAVVGFGGYVSIPVVLSAYILRITVVLHEQTLEAGLANKFLSKFATKICISWNSSRKYFPKEKTISTGNPIRKLSAQPQAVDIKNRTIYITGGSSGSHFINVTIEGCIKELLEKYKVIHQTGDAQEFHDFDRLTELKKTLPNNLGEKYTITKFVEPSEVGGILNKAALVIGRSGMNTITELIYFEKPSLLIPIPFSSNNEQLKNARFLEKLGLGKILLQNEVNPRRLLQAVNLMFHNLDNFKVREAEGKHLSGKNATRNIIEVINYVNKKKVQARR